MPSLLVLASGLADRNLHRLRAQVPRLSTSSLYSLSRSPAKAHEPDQAATTVVEERPVPERGFSGIARPLDRLLRGAR